MPNLLPVCIARAFRGSAGGLFACVLLLCGSRCGTAEDASPQRARNGLQVFYDFGSVDGEHLKDVSGQEQPLELRITDPKSVHQSVGNLEIVGKVLVRSESPATRLTDAIKQSGAITIEAWVRSANAQQSGPARIVTLSRNANERNFTLGQDGDRFEVRLRTTKTSNNGIPSLVSKPKSLAADWTHVAYTFDRAGKASLYIDGKLNVEQQIGGAVSNWDGGFHFGLGNELSNDRPWLGALRLVAVYNRDLSPSEIEQNFRAGTTVSPPSVEEKLAQQQTGNAKLFQVRIAPLLSKHCLECHDTLTKKGKLDLSHKAASTSSNSRVIVAGKSAESLLWTKVVSNEMPHDRPPLSTDEKKWLQQWIDGGANWSLAVIDPAVYAQGDGSQKVFVQRLTVPEYIATVQSTVGVDVAKEAREHLPRDLRADGFSNTAYNLTVDLEHIEAYAKLAEIIAERIDIQSLVKKHTKSREMTDENLTKVIEPIGRRLLRGPLGKDEVAHYCGISTTVAGAGGNIEEAARYILEAMLQSPRFLYRIERQPGGGAAQPVESFELASRLSYIVWGGPPDDELLLAAEKGKLDRAGVEAQSRRMLQDRRAIERSRVFITEWLNLDRLDDLRPDPKKFPNWEPGLAADMRNETLAVFEEIVWKQNRPLSELLNAQVTFVTPRLARHYGLPTDRPADSGEMIRYDLSKVAGRGGLLTQGSVLTVGGDDASMVSRGLFLMHELLRGVVRDPPPGTDTTPVPSKPGLTQRAIAESRIANKSCTGCHAKFEPLAFALEKFDGVGAFHESDEHGNKLSDDGRILFPGEERPVAYRSSAELMDLLAKSERVRETLTWKVTQFAVGRPLGAADAPVIADIHKAAQQAGGTYPGLLTAILTSDLVRMTRTETKP